MQVVRLPDWKLLTYMLIPFRIILSLFIAVEVSDPFRVHLHVSASEVRDKPFYYCWAGKTGMGISIAYLLFTVSTIRYDRLQLFRVHYCCHVSLGFVI